MRSVAARTAIRTVIMNASNAFAPIAQSTSQMMSPMVVATTSPMRRRTLSAQGVGHRGHDLAHRGGRVVRLARGAHQPAADDHAVGARGGGLGRVLGRGDPEPERDRYLGVRL